MDLSLLLAIALLVALFFWLKRFRGRGRRYGSNAGSKPSRPPTPTSRSVSGRTKRELFRLVGGNQAVAQRLVDQVQLRNPDHSEQWCWEKAIYDIERDRHSS